MQKYNGNEFFFDPDNMEDISSHSPKQLKKDRKKTKKRNLAAAYGNGIFKRLGNIIKAISFLIAFAILGVCLLAAFFLFSKDKFFTAIAIGIALLGVVIATITMFLIYGIGHVICQNNEILRELQDKDYY